MPTSRSLAVPPRRLFLPLVFALLLAVATGSGLYWWAYHHEPDLLEVHQSTLTLPGWPRALDGLKVVAISDIHAGAPYIDDDKLERITRVVNAARPDLIVMLGDYMIQGIRGGQFMPPEQLVQHLRGFSAPLGVTAVIGNHDWWYNGGKVRTQLEQVGFKVLDNEVTRLEHNGQPLWVAGIADQMTQHPDIPGTLAKAPAGEPVLMITHNPDIFPEVPARVSLTLAGHTHGGQVNLPLLGRKIVPSKFGDRYALGEIVEGGRHLFVTTGIGTSVVPVRFRVPPEIAVLTLRSGGP